MDLSIFCRNGIRSWWVGITSSNIINESDGIRSWWVGITSSNIINESVLRFFLALWSCCLQIKLRMIFFGRIKLIRWSLNIQQGNNTWSLPVWYLIMPVVTHDHVWLWHLTMPVATHDHASCDAWLCQLRQPIMSIEAYPKHFRIVFVQIYFQICTY